MIISRTPFRISFFGGGTDYPAWYRNHGGSVLSTTIDKYCYLTVRYLPPFFDHRIRIVYSAIESCKNVDEIKHPAVREIMRYMAIDRGVEIHHDGDLPARSGMGSSSSFTVGLLHAFHALLGRMPTQKQLADMAIHIEQDIIKECVGSQDQVSAAHGGLNLIHFLEDGAIHCQPVTIPSHKKEELERHIMLFYTGIKRTAANVAESYTRNIEARRWQLRVMKDLVEEGLAILVNNRPIKAFGELLNESWKVKTSLSEKVTNPEVNAIYEAARTAGAIGGKLTGAGGGGFFMFFVPPESQEAVRTMLHKLIHVPIRFETNGSQIIFYDMERDYADEERIRNTKGDIAFRELAPKENETWPN